MNQILAASREHVACEALPQSRQQADRFPCSILAGFQEGIAKERGIPPFGDEVLKVFAV